MAGKIIVLHSFSIPSYTSLTCFHRSGTFLTVSQMPSLLSSRYVGSQKGLTTPDLENEALPSVLWVYRRGHYYTDLFNQESSVDMAMFPSRISRLRNVLPREDMSGHCRFAIFEWWDAMIFLKILHNILH